MNTDSSFIIIMAGGIGSRFWPLSRNRRPKQFLDLLGIGKSLLQMTYDRFRPEYSTKQIFVVTSEEYVDLVLEQLPELDKEQIIAEPQRKNTAACIAYSAFKLNNKFPNSTMIVTPADHLILEKDTFIHTIQKGVEFIKEKNNLLTLGIKPTKPHTGYGYIQFTENKKETVKAVKTFTEKPTLKFAKEFLDSGEFLWNSGIFIWNTSKILSSFQSYLPDLYESFKSIDYNTTKEKEQIKQAYETCTSTSIDYGILEKEKNIFVLPASFTWSDLGTWDALHEISEKDNNNNVVNKKTIQLKNVSNSIVHQLGKEKIIILQDVDNLIVVETDDALVISDKNSEQKIKEIVQSLSANDLDKYL